MRTAVSSTRREALLDLLDWAKEIGPEEDRDAVDGLCEFSTDADIEAALDACSGIESWHIDEHLAPEAKGTEQL